jgi:hypothetical protein
MAEGLSGRGTLAVPEDGRLRDNPALVAVCPAGAASFRVTALTLVPSREPPAVARSAWAWKPESWRIDPEALLSAAERHAIGRLFVSVEIADDVLKHEAEFASFVTMARARGVAVVPVEGDPAMALAEGRAMAVRRLRVLAAYQSRAAPEARLAGVQYDIEPYLLPYAADPEPILSGWAETLRALKDAAGDLPLDLALPFWLPEDEAAERLVLPAVEAVASSVTAMAYQTTADALQRAAEPLLAWGAVRGRAVHVALEAGPLDDEVTRRYREAPGGELLAVPHEGGSLLLLATASGPTRGARSFALERETVAAAENVSFLRRVRADEYGRAASYS